MVRRMQVRRFKSSDINKMITKWRETGGETVFLASDDFQSDTIVADFNLNTNTPL